MSLFEGPSNIELSEEPLGPGATILRNFAISEETEILSGLSDVVSKAPFRHMITPGGFRMSVAMTNCGALGWVTDRTGYRYDLVDPESGQQNHIVAQREGISSAFSTRCRLRPGRRRNSSGPLSEHHDC